MDFFELCDCESCLLNNSGRVSSRFDNKEQVDIIILGKSPNRQEVLKKELFVGDTGNLIRPILKAYTENVMFINVLGCRPVDSKGNDRQPKASEIKACRPRTLSELDYVINKYNPKLVILLGTVAQAEYSKLLDYKPQYVDIPHHHLEHPSYILHNRQIMPRYIKDFNNVLKSVFCSNIDTIIDKQFIDYTPDLYDMFTQDYKSSELVGVDIETNSKDLLHKKEFFIGTTAVSCDKYTWFFDYRNSDIRECLPLRECLAYEGVKKVFTNIMYDVVGLGYKGFEVVNYTDIQPLAFLYDNTLIKYDLESLVLRYAPEWGTYKSRFKATLVDGNYLGASKDVLRVYNSADAYTPKLIYRYLYANIDKATHILFERVTERLLPVLVHMCMSGFNVDWKLWDLYKQMYEERLQEIKEKFKDEYGIANIMSPQQISKWLYEDLKLKPFRFSAETKQPSTDKFVIKAFAKKVPKVLELYEARKLAKLLSDLVAAMWEFKDDKGYIHPNYKHFGIQSGRLSCTKPNLHGVPRDVTEFEVINKYPFRRVFTSRGDDWYIVDCDFSQQEIRIIAELSGDPNLIKAYSLDKDVHKFVASLVFGKKEEEVSKFERQVAKSCSFGTVYGISEMGLADTLNVSVKEAKRYLDTFFRTFPRVKMFIDKSKNDAIRQGFVRTILGRPRKFVITKKNAEAVKREATNHKIQSTAADIGFLSLINLYNGLKGFGLLGKYAYIVHMVHDSIMLDVHKTCLDFVKDYTVKTMSEVPAKLGFKVKFDVDVKVSKQWGGE